MLDIPSAVWFPVVTLIAGLGLKYLADLAQNKWNIAREREARHEARRDKISERRLDLQRESMLAMQYAVVEMTRAASEVHRHNSIGNNASVPMETFLNHANRTVILGSRVDDEKVRLDLENLQNKCVTLTNSASDIISLQDAYQHCTNLNKRIGKLLRTIDGIGSLAEQRPVR